MKLTAKLIFIFFRWDTEFEGGAIWTEVIAPPS